MPPPCRANARGGCTRGGSAVSSCWWHWLFLFDELADGHPDIADAVNTFAYVSDIFLAVSGPSFCPSRGICLHSRFYSSVVKKVGGKEPDASIFLWTFD